MNSTHFLGRFVETPELKQTPNGTAVCSFTLAVKRPHTKDVTDFINFTAWRQTAEFITKYFSKGQMIAVSGYLTSRRFEDANGNKRTAFEVQIEEAEFCGSKPATDEAPNYNSTGQFEELSAEDELPF